ncbi:MAG: CsbD family protein [Flavitalea sp.]
MQTQTLKLSTSWEEVKENLKETNIELTDEDLAYEHGKEDELLERLQKKIKMPKEQIRDLIESISENKGKAG